MAADAAALSDGGDAVRRWVGSGGNQATPWNTLNPIGLTPQCPVLLAHGEEDEDVPIAMSQACTGGYTARGSTANSCPPGDHYTIIDPMHKSWEKATRILELIML